MTTGVTAVMAVRDGAAYLDEALDSVLAEPEITETIVVDDGSSDATPAILLGYSGRVTVLRREPRGQAAALNEAIAAASSPMLAFQDADDVWPPGRTARLLAALVDGADVASGPLEQFLSPDLPPAAAARVRLVQSSHPAPLLATSLIRRDAFAIVGPLDTTLRTGANIDWAARAGSAGLRFATVGDITLRRRIHAANIGRQIGATARNDDLFSVLRAHLDRRRTTGSS